ncbi:MAG TPA: NYN domain-containing protein [Cyanobacteria bacterium UBA11149]|nr:NYN domain-containing protein [Cyanobacteria bacterium UBA11367]HBE57993.1 NYN domain-containing protein [Cyanobacteria bacterium UBA11366]HBK62467.1 NYN domain-containing protein [Cyanobacteria bacterium UBA11166]HBR73996.1 NYN domain-containing protein [Cyanobacteria bacterium UBA11159]HBS72103.1 NYN domain-containing protein [Cyanobacteria bacterium UBA11153]HBW91292.1 NYN domain-containing protein [Cyanobacteria bacterium UBA11149]HCA96244.1 NYN domain-containing protein [Cyanobacteria
MQDNSIVQLVNDSAIIEQISLIVYQAVVDMQQQQPQLLQEKYRKIDWRDRRYQSAFCSKLKTQLGESIDWNTRLRKIHKLLHFFMVSAYFQTPEFREMAQTVQTAIRRQIKVESNGLVHSENPQPPLSSSVNSLPGIAILLLDAENLQIDIETEKFLGRICNYPIQIKVAFANWRSMGKKDAEFHNRGYELIHVPPGKDSADVKMATVGSSIFVHYPTAREVLVCSSDGVMTHLYNTLQTHGLTVYLVRKKGDYITVLNSQTNQTKSHNLNTPTDLPSPGEFIAQLKQIIKDEQTKTGQDWLRLSRISSRFQTKYKMTLSRVVAIQFTGKKVRDIFIDNPTEFAVHQLPGESGVYITTFEIPSGSTPSNETIIRSDNSSQTGNSNLLKPDSRVNLEQVVTKIVTALTVNSTSVYVPIANVATEFNRQEGQSITNVLKTLKLGNKFPRFLQSCSGLKVKKVGAVYHVGILSS